MEFYPGSEKEKATKFARDTKIACIEARMPFT